MRTSGARVILDNGHEILREYLGTVGGGAPGAGGEFVRWLFRHQYNPKQCVRVDISQLPDEPFYEPYPADVGCAMLDLSDRKFLSAAMASAPPRSVANATDSDWCEVVACMTREDIGLTNACPSVIYCEGD